MTARYVVRRLLQVPLALGAVLVVTFFIVRALPGDPVSAIAPDADEAQAQQVRRDLGLDRPLPVQFTRYAVQVLQGDLGESYVQGRPVADIIKGYAKPTLLLTGTALVISTVMGVFFAIVAVRRPSGWGDKLINAVMLVAYALPGFWVAQLAIIYLVLKLGLFPLSGYSEFGGRAPTGFGHLIDVGLHLTLPALVLALSELAAVTRVTRSGLLEEMSQGYVRTAAAKGLAADQIMSHHALRNALLPLVTLIGTRVGFLLSGAAIIESIFAWPGLGSLLVAAAGTNDRPVMLGMVLVASFTVIVASLMTDVIYRWVDPRIRYD